MERTDESSAEAEDSDAGLYTNTRAHELGVDFFRVR